MDLHIVTSKLKIVCELCAYAQVGTHVHVTVCMDKEREHC